MIRYSLTQHAQDRLEKRQIQIEWIERAVTAPELIEADRSDPDLRHYLVTIPEYGKRVLRVIVNETTIPVNIVTFYFDRSMRGKL